MLRNQHSRNGLLIDWLRRFQRWRCSEEARRALAAINTNQLDQLSETGRQVRREALRRLQTDRLSSNPSS
jgi:hypothetical protein